MPELNRDLSRLSLEEIAAIAAGMSRPPIEKWDPPLTGHSQIKIARDGSWFHEGSLIRRENLVRLFSSILRREGDGSYALVTPHEKQTVEVEDMPFLAVEVKAGGEREGRSLAFRLNIGDMVFAGPENPLHFDAKDDQPAPSILVRDGLAARIARPVFYELAELALTEANDPPGLWSNGAFFSMAALA